MTRDFSIVPGARNRGGAVRLLRAGDKAECGEQRRQHEECLTSHSYTFCPFNPLKRHFLVRDTTGVEIHCWDPLPIH